MRSMITSIVSVVFLCSIGFAESDAVADPPKQCCMPSYGVHLLAVTDGVTNLDHPSSDFFSAMHTDWIYRVFYGWEKLEVHLGLCVFSDDLLGYCEISVADPGDWFRGCKIKIVEHSTQAVVLEQPWEPGLEEFTKRGYHKRGLKINNSRFAVDDNRGISAKRVLELVAKDGKPLDPGYYWLEADCDLDALSTHWQGVGEVCKPYDMKERKRALKMSRRLIEIVKPSNDREREAEAIRRAGRLGKDSLDAIPYLQEAIRINPNSIVALELLSSAYINNGMMEEARKTLEHCIKVSKERNSCHMNLGFMNNPSLPRPWWWKDPAKTK